MNVEDEVFGQRLEEERARLKLSKAAMAQAGDVSAGAYSNYLRGTRVPDLAALAAWSSAGVDVLYVVVGRRMPDLLTPEEEVVLGGYRKLDTRGRAGVLALIGGMLDQSSANVRIKGEVGQYVEGDLTVTQPFTINMGRKKKKE
ncbi:Phage DNA-binding protein [Cupriavidus taiwanensis]|uniref:Phage DNA-binding protein n=1 Tax=Cupriavidus taiwanensis TaxID=164546 RepID=A0A375IG78_9BURK|nr:helix-turn-helix transcriptional regulator [Cupriavidus taiwanensis]SPK73070.1 Phage DNA-binding protein [Cupriavidus taiwanensis]